MECRGQTMAFSRIEWVTVGPERARSHLLYGFGGWNWLLAAALLLQGLSPLSILPIAWGIALSLVLLVPVVALVLNSRAFRPIFFTYAGLVALAAFTSKVPAFIAMSKVPAGAGMPSSLVIIILMAIYVNESRRINVTMCHRVRADDPFLTEATA